MAGTNFNAILDIDTKLVLTDDDGHATRAECNGNPNVVATDANVFVPGCIMLRTDFNGGNNLYQNVGTLSVPNWAIVTSGGGGTPGGVNTSVQYNDAGAFGGDVNFIWDKVPKVFQVGDPNNFTNGTSIVLSDASQNIDISTNLVSFYSAAQGRILGRINASTATIQFGDINPVGNNTLFYIDDVFQHVNTWSGNGGHTTGTQIDMLPTATSMAYVNAGTPWGFSANSNGGGATEIIANNNAWIWPNAYGAAGTVLTDVAGNGILSWAAPSGGTITGTGALGQATYWTGATAIAGSADFLWNNATKGFGVGDMTGTQNNTRYVLDDLNSDHIFTTTDELSVETPGSVKFFRTGFNAGQPFTHFGDLGSTGTDTVFALNDAGGTISATVANFFAIDSAPAFTRWFRVDPPITDIGDISSAGNDTLVTINDTAELVDVHVDNGFRVIQTNGNSWFEVSPAGSSIMMGDLSGLNNSTQLTVDDVNSQVSFGRFTGVTAANAVFDTSTHTANINFNIVNIGDSNSSANDTLITVNDVTEAITLQSTGTINIGDPASIGNDTNISMNDTFGSVLLTANFGFSVRDSSNNFWYQLFPGFHSQTMGDISAAFNRTTFQVDDVARLIISQAVIAGTGGTARTNATGSSIQYATGGTTWGFQASNSGGGATIIIANNQSYSWPNVDGTTGSFLVTDGSGVLSFQTLLAFSSDAAAGVGGLTTGEMYQTNGGGVGVFAFTGVVMVKQ